MHSIHRRPTSEMSKEKQDLLAPANYDADASSIHSDSESEDGKMLAESRTTLELREHDRSVLRDEEETERLLSKPTRLESIQNAFRSNPRDGQPHISPKGNSRRRRPAKRKRQRPQSLPDSGSEGELMYEMEEGYKDTSSQASSSSMELDKKTWEGRHDSKVKSGRNSLRRKLFFHLVVIALFCALAFGAYRASTRYRQTQTAFTLSNGTHLFAPTTILISLDGFRADFLNRGLTPTLNEFIAQGVSPRYMNPSFPSVTFPNHFTLVTGLYPESHGVVGNSFWDPELADEFYYTDPDRSMNPKWWNAEPIWVTAESQGIRTAIHMWPGSEAHIPTIEPTFLDKFNGDESLSNKVDRILQLIDLPGDVDQVDATSLRPQLIAAYVPNVDADGHRYGPNSTEIRTTISRVDSMLADLFQGLQTRNLTSIVNIVIVSDHGMATTSNDRLVQLDDMIDLDLVDHIDGWPLRGLRLKNPERDLQSLYEILLNESEKSDGFEVYTRETMPERYHFTNNDRIAPLWIIPKAGWAIVDRTSFDIEKANKDGQVFRPKGIHGYDHEHPLMRAIAIMRGPSFPHEPNSRVDVFQNIEIYNIICDSLGIVPNPSNGTLRLPLKPVGIHEEDVPPADDFAPEEPKGTQVWGLPDDADIPSGTSLPAAEDDGGTEVDVSDQDEIVSADEPTSTADTSGTLGTWVDFFKDRLDAAKEWAEGVIDDLKNKGWRDPEKETG